MPIICVECSKIWSEELEIAYFDYCEDCASPEIETFNCPECEIEDGILLFVMMGGVRKVTREPAVGIRMALLTGFHHPVKAYVGIRIIHFLNIVGSVTIGASGCFKIAQCVSFAVDGFCVGF